MECKSDSESKSEGEGGLYLEKHRATGTSKGCRSHSSTIVSASFHDLPYEIILNILSRPPVKSVLQCRCVSKTWCNIIDDPSLTITKTNSADGEKHHLMLLCHPIEWIDKTRLFSLKEEGNILRTSEYPIAEFVNALTCHLSAINLGILIFRNRYYTAQSFLLNPCRQEVLMLPPATVLASPTEMVEEHYGFGFGFGFDSTTNVYKVVHFFTGCHKAQNPMDYVAEVYTLGTKSWRQISSVCPYRVCLMPISAYGDVHWMVSYDIPKGSAESMIISFDFKREEFKLTPHPDFRCKKYEYFHLLDLRGSLAIVDLSSTTHMEIWVLKDYGRKEWAQEYRISIEERLCFQVPYFTQHYSRVVGAWEEGLLFQLFIDYTFLYCNLKTGSLRYFSGIVHTTALSNKPGFLDQLNSCADIYSYKGSLVSLRNYGNLMVKEVGTGNCFNINSVKI